MFCLLAVVFCFVCFVFDLIIFCQIYVGVYSLFAFGKALLWRLHGRTHSCIAISLNSAWAVVVVDSKVTEARENFVEDEC